MSDPKYKIEEGYMPFKGYKTYYRIVGEKSDKKKPLLLLHGGPGSTHNYFEVLDKLSLDGRQIISYDQIGCGNSFVDNHPELWTLETWIDELKNIREYLKLEELHLLGQSWGGMLQIAYMCDEKPQGVKSNILSSTLPSSQLWGKEQHRRIKYLSIEDQKAIEEAEKSGNYDTKEYQTANEHFMERHCNYEKNENTPKCLLREKKFGTEAYITAWGPNEFTPVGNLKDFNYIGKLKEWKVPTLIVSGTSDLCSPLIAKTMFDEIPNSKWELFEDCKHCCFVDQNEKYVNLVKEWLNKYD